MNKATKNLEILDSEVSKVEQSLSEKGIDNESIEKSHVHEVVGERLNEVAQGNGVTEYTPSPSSHNVGIPAYFTPELQPLVQNLIDVAWSKGVDTAFKEAFDTHNMALVDAFRDAVADELFDELVSRKEIKKLAA